MQCVPLQGLFPNPYETAAPNSNDFFGSKNAATIATIAISNHTGFFLSCCKP